MPQKTSRPRNVLIKTFLFLPFLIPLGTPHAFAQTPHDHVEGNLIQFNDNGAWSWYQDERAVVNAPHNTLLLGSDASRQGVGGSSRDGHIEGIIFDLNTRQPERYLFMNAGADDHNVPAFLVLPNDTYLAMYAQHYDTYSRYRIYDGTTWSNEQVFDWGAIPGGSNFTTTYSNLFYLAAEDKVYNISRADERSPNLIESTDYGATWSYVGLLTQPDENIGYVNGYFKYWGNGVDRIDFIATEHHPRDFNTSMYHGYIHNGQSFNSDGELMDADLTDKSAPNPDDYTPVFAANTVVNGDLMSRVWNMDLHRYDDGSIAALIKARVNDDPARPSNDPDHVFFYCRYDGTAWSYTYLGKAGTKLYGSEQDYTGLGALHPNDPTIIYISTPYDPRDDAALGVHEIFKGVTSDGGTSWTWTPITQNSTRDNMRPIVPLWNATNTALLWWRGTYFTAQSFDAAVVGLIERSSESPMPMQYVDASAGNTTYADGSAFDFTGPAPERGTTDDLWHERSGVGNGGSVFASAEREGEDAPLLQTTVHTPEAGTYDVWVNFWANPDGDWRILAGLSEDRMQIFRHMASQQVNEGRHTTSLSFSGGGNTFLYQAYLGRVQVSTDETFEVVVDDYAIETGSATTLSGDQTRTWYDGVSYAPVDALVVDLEDSAEHPNDFRLTQNYPNPFTTRTTIRVQVPSTGHVELRVYDILGRDIQTLMDDRTPAGTYDVTFDGSDLPSGVYIYKLTTGSATTLKTMLLVK